MNKKNKAYIKISAVHQFYYMIFGIQTIVTILMTILSAYTPVYILQLSLLMGLPCFYYWIFSNYFNNMDQKRDTLEILPYHRSIERFYRNSLIIIVLTTCLINIGIAFLISLCKGNFFFGISNLAILIEMCIVFLLFRGKYNKLNSYGMFLLMGLCSAYYVAIMYFSYK